MTGAAPTDPLAPLRADPGRSAVVTDFDGTLSEHVDDPSLARPVPGAVDALVALVGSYRMVAVVSGRPLAFLQQVLPSSLHLAGLYGLQVAHEGVVVEHPEAARWRQVVSAASAAALRELPAGALVEPKELSLTLHYRTAPPLQAEIEHWALATASQTGLHARPARLSVELHPPLAVDKGTVIEELAEGCAAACFLGDDVGDLPAFDGLDRLAARGVAVARVAVVGAMSDAELVERADVSLPGPGAAVDLLRSLRVPA